MLKNFILLFFISSFLKCQTTNTITFTIDGKSFEFVTYEKTQEYYKNGMLKKCQLSEPQQIQGFICKDWIYFDIKGNITQFQNAGAYKFNTNIIPESSTIFINSKKIIESIWPSKETYINGIKNIGNLKSRISFFENGNTKSCYLKENVNIQGYPCLASTSKPVTFYENGKLKKFTISEEFLLTNKRYKKGSTLLVEPLDNIIFYECPLTYQN